MTTSEIDQKLAMLKRLADAIARAKANQLVKKDERSAIELQDLQQQRRELRATLPALRAVN